MTQFRALIQKHRFNGLLLDSNLFLLYLIGSTNEGRIVKFSRTQMYTVEDFRLLRDFAQEFQTIITTPHVLTEVNSLAKLKEPELHSLRLTFRQIVDRTEEYYEPSKSVMTDPSFATLGLTDAALRVMAARPVLIITDDLPFYHYVSGVGLDVINFNHVRQYLF